MPPAIASAGISKDFERCDSHTSSATLQIVSPIFLLFNARWGYEVPATCARPAGGFTIIRPNPDRSRQGMRPSDGFGVFRRLIFAALLGFAPAAWATDAPQRGGINASPSLTIPTSPSARLGPEGFLSRWLLLEPIPGDGRVVDSAVRAAAKKEYFPEQFSILPRAGDKVSVNGADYAWHAVDSSHHNVNLYHFAFFLGKPTANVVFWGVTLVDSPDEISDVRLAVGSNAGSVWWVNGVEVVAIYGDRQTSIDDGVSRKLVLHKGPNIVRFLVVQNGGMVDCCARFLDAHDQPLTRLTQRLTAPSP